MPSRADRHARIAGYASPAYAAALGHVGEPLALPGSGGWLLERDVPATNGRDAVGPYPVFACADWSRLGDDLAALTDLVTVTLVTDPFGDWTPELLQSAFPDVARPYKRHLIADLADPQIDAHHRRNIRYAAARVAVEVVEDPAGFADEWVGLYDDLVRSRGATGPAAFPPESLRAQLAVPGMLALRATRAGETVAASLWLLAGDVGYYHLGASSEEGYAARASFALFAAAMDTARARCVTHLSLGAGAGVEGDAADGLNRFKRGWASDGRDVWLCGRVTDPAAYRELAPAAGSDFFPAYRAP